MGERNSSARKLIHGIEVPSSDFHRNVGMYLDECRDTPVVITSHGRTKAVLLSASEYQRLMESANRPTNHDGETLEIDISQGLPNDEELNAALTADTGSTATRNGKKSAFNH